MRNGTLPKKADNSGNNKSDKQDIFEKEWEQARSATDKFDQILVDLRKAGFAIVTGLTTADGLLRYLISTPVIFASIILATMIFIALWYWLDRYYYNLLMAVVIRARFLEEYRLDSIRLSTFIGGFTCKRANTVLHFIYVSMVAAIFLLGFFAYYQEGSDHTKEINELNINRTGVENKLSPSDIQKDIQIQEQLSQINHDDYQLFLPILIGAASVSSIIMISAYYLADHKRNKILKLYDCLKAIYDEDKKKQDANKCQEKLKKHLDSKNDIAIKKGDIDELEKIFMSLFNEESKRFVTLK